MRERTFLCLLIFILYFHFALCLFYHESSRILAKANDTILNTGFGFSVKYMDTIPPVLVVGAPRYDFIGKLYTCPISKSGEDGDITCYPVDIDVKSLVNYTRDLDQKQNFYLGASIAATPDYFFTCAPMLTTAVINMIGREEIDAYGICLSYQNSTAYRYTGNMERYVKNKRSFRNKKLFQGGTGWNTLVDKTNDLLLISKTTLNGDLLYLPLSNPKADSKSLVFDMTPPQAKKWASDRMNTNTNMGYGLAVGKFYSNSTIYALSMTTKKMTGEIAFIELSERNLVVSKVKKTVQNESNLTDTDVYLIINNKVGSMFGAAMEASDINLDGFSELLVGAPTFYDEEFEYGAVHIYIGGIWDNINDKNRIRTIVGTKEQSRFGSAIATDDIDLDGIPDIIISAPYEDSGSGAVYVLSGYEVNKILLGSAMLKQIQVTHLKFIQRIQPEGQRTFGFSLQIIPSIGDKDCKDLVVGSPGTASVLLFRCLSVINVTVSTQIVGAQTVRVHDKNFTIAVCVTVKYPMHDVEANLTLSNDIIGDEAYIPKQEYLISLSEKKPSYCENVSVVLVNNDPGDYKFTANVNLNNSVMQNSTIFNSAWVTLSPYSKTNKTIEISRRCDKDDCNSKLLYEIVWSGKENYTLGSSDSETVTILVRNEGHDAYKACLWASVSGAQVALAKCSNDEGRYKCYLPKPLRRYTEHSITFELNMTRPISNVKKLTVNVKLYEDCNALNNTENNLEVYYTLDPSPILVEGSNKERNVTDKEIMDTKNPVFDDGHEYLIINKGPVLWKRVTAVVTIEKRAFIQHYASSSTETNKGNEENKTDTISFTYHLNLMPNSTTKLIAAMKIVKNKIRDNLVDGKLNTTSNILLLLTTATDVKLKRITTTFTFQQEISFINNKNLMILIGIILALILLAIIIFILHRVHFFKRNQKRKLVVLRESIKRRSVRRHESSADNDSAKVSDGIECIEMEVIEDSPFGDNPAPVSCNDDIVLIEEKAQVHC